VTKGKQEPPYNGFGSEEDSLGNCKALVSKPPKIDMEKRMKYDGVTLRYMARLMTGVPEDELKQFILSFFLEDNTILIYQMSQKNSGIH
jgi:hypothetical protein